LFACYGLAKVAAFLVVKGDSHSQSMFLEGITHELKQTYSNGSKLAVCQALSRTVFERDTVELMKQNSHVFELVEFVLGEASAAVDDMVGKCREKTSARVKISGGKESLGFVLICSVALENGWILWESKRRLLSGIATISEACGALVLCLLSN
jgi:hypothetical protein